MPLETSGNIDEIAGVTDQEGEPAAPATNEAQGNWDTLDGVQYTTNGTGEEQLPSNDVPDGATVLVHPLPSNADVVNVGPAGVVTYPLADAVATYTAKVSNTDQITVQTPSAGDGVAVHWEANE